MGMEESAVDKNYDIAGEEPIHIIEEPKFSLKTIDEVNWEKDIVLAVLEFTEGVINVKNEIEIDGKTRKVRRYAGFTEKSCKQTVWYSLIPTKITLKSLFQKCADSLT